MPGSLYWLAKIYEGRGAVPQRRFLYDYRRDYLVRRRYYCARCAGNTGYMPVSCSLRVTLTSVRLSSTRSVHCPVWKQLVTGKKTRKDHPQVMNAAIRLYADAANAKTKLENGFDLTNYDERTLAFAKDYSNQLLAIGVSLDLRRCST